MSSVVEQPRQFCALGAQQTVVAIERAIPIIHGGPGCGFKLYLGASFGNGFQGAGYASGNCMPSTNTGEREVVFGGEDRLRQEIEGALKVMDGDLFVVLTACTVDLVGDDTAQVVREFQECGAPIVYAQTAGFKDYSFAGHELVVNAIIDQFLEPTPEKNPRLVNVWSVVPYQDTFWNGNLHALKNLLEGIGLEANILFGYGSGGVEAWKKIPAARFNLVISPWNGLKIAQRLQERFGTPYLHYPVLPIGAVETSNFLRTVAGFAYIHPARAELFIQEKEKYFYHYLDRAADFFLEFRLNMPSRFSVIADSGYVLGITRFLVNELGLLPSRQFIIDNPPDAHRPELARQLAELAPGVSAEVTFTQDGGEVQDRLREQLPHLPLFVLGSGWDKDIAHDLFSYHLSIALPVTDRLVMDRAYVGYEGGLRLIEDMYTTILNTVQ